MDSWPAPAPKLPVTRRTWFCAACMVAAFVATLGLLVAIVG